MSIGSGIALVVIGAILSFTLNVSTSVIDLALVGNILMGAGAVIFILGIIALVRKRRSVETVSAGIDPENGQQVTERKTVS